MHHQHLLRAISKSTYSIPRIVQPWTQVPTLVITHQRYQNTSKKVYSFEPNPITYDVLNINCKYAAIERNIVPLPYGLSDKEGELPFVINATNIGGSHILPNDHHVDDQREKIKLIKIDVEGHEINALKGAKMLLIQIS